VLIRRWFKSKRRCGRGAGISNDPLPIAAATGRGSPRSSHSLL